MIIKLSLVVLLLGLSFGIYHTLNTDRWNSTKKISNNQQFDFIVIGSGSAGAVVASRLSENPKHTVLLLESGYSDDKLEVKLPAAFSKLFKTKYDWEYYTVPQKHLNNRILYLPRAKMMGGCSSMNAMIFNRGHPEDYNTWAKLGNEGWSFDEVLPYFLKLENNSNTKLSPEFHGFNGPMHIEDLKEGTKHESIRVFIESCKTAGIPIYEASNGFSDEGIGFTQVHMKNGKRWSVADGYLTNEVVARPNLFIRLGVHVSKIVIKDQRAIGVEILESGEKKFLKANKEVIVSAGAYNSPQLLMLSGVGPKEHLESLGIKVVKDLPGVGKNLQDHLLTGVAFNLTQLGGLDTEESLFNLAQWLIRHQGPLASNVAEAIGFIKSPYAKDIPDLELIAGAAFYFEHGFEKPDGGSWISAGPVLLRPESRGTVKLRSKDPFDPPEIDPNFFSSEYDRKAIEWGTKKVIEIMRTKPMANYIDKMHKGEVENDDEAFRIYIKNTVQVLYHPQGTCKMGPKNDPEAVVDPKLKVYGVEGLRVVDASIIPIAVSGHTNAPTIMIGEKAADMIKNDWK